MNGIEKISTRIQEETQAQVDRILQEARTKAQQIVADYENRAKAEEVRLAARNEKAAAEREERLVSVAQMESRKVILAAKQEVVSKAYDKAQEMLASMSDAEYIQVLAQLMQKAASTGHEEVVFSKKDAKSVGKAAVSKANELIPGGQLSLAQEHRDISGGFILKDGKVEVNCTFETLVRLQKTETAGAVASKLFPEA